MIASCSWWVWVFKRRQIDSRDSNLCVLCRYSWKEYSWHYKFEHKARQMNIKKLFWQKELSFEISKGSWYTSIFHRKSTNRHTMSFYNTCYPCKCWFLSISSKASIHLLLIDIESISIFWRKGCLQWSPTYFPCYLRSTLVISLRGIGGSKKSRLLLISKRPS